MMKNLQIFKVAAVVTTVCSLFFVSCDKPAQTSVYAPVTVSVSKSQVNNDEGSVFVSVQTAGKWRLELDFGEETSPWATLSETSGSKDRGDIFLRYEANDTEEGRSLTVIASSGNYKSECSLVQGQGVPVNPGGQVREDPYAGWLELPAISASDNRMFFTHYADLGGKNMRSWSYDWDPDALVAIWVAYPLNQSLVGSGSRTDEWGLDPKLPRDMQPVLYKGFKGGYDRGHQLPSADRLSYQSNVQTFYGTNMTPQRGELNQKAWASLEGRVRDWARALDTLYVVTGCSVEGSSSYAYDNDGKAVTVPVGYFKALLGYKKSGTVGITGSTGGYTACAFWFDHKAYSGDVMNQAMTVTELEAITGLDFFANLPAKTSSSIASRVESTRDSWWF